MTRFFSLREEQSRFSPKGKHNPPTKKKKKISTVDAARTPTPTAKTAQRTREGACEGRKLRDPARGMDASPLSTG